MSYLALFTIKNTDFDFTDYGLTGNSFVVDITKSVQAQKQVNFTQYPLLDGTTRIANVSRQPGTLNFQGMVGDLYHRTTNPAYVLTEGIEYTRTQNFVRLLEDLRDQAIVLDITTENKVFENYLIQSVGFGIAQLGVIDVNFSMREYIAFGKTLAGADYNSETGLNEDGTVPPSEDYQGYLNALTIANFQTPNELQSEIYSILTDANLAEPFIITFGAGDINADVRIPNFFVRPPELDINDVYGIILLQRQRTYTPTQVVFDRKQATYFSGQTSDGYSISVTLPSMLSGSLVQEETIRDITDFLEQNAFYEYKGDQFIETGKHLVTIKLVKDQVVEETINDIELLVTPRYSNVANGVNPYGQDDTLENDLLLQTEDFDITRSVYSFIRPTSDPDVYRVLPNLLSDIRDGYLYAANYIKKLGDTGAYAYQISFVYLHPQLISKIRSLINDLATYETTNLLYRKTIEWPWE